jgi:hypothetical protein
MSNFDVYIEFELLKAKVPVIFLGTQGFSARKDRRYAGVFWLHGQMLSVSS